MVRSILSVFLSILLAFAPGLSYAQNLLPQQGTTLSTSGSYIPILIKGMKVHPENPVLFDFIVDNGHSGLGIDTQAFQDESRKLIKYFLAALTIKEKDLWVNLSPYEKDRMLSDELGLTEMGQEMLAQDYLLKQLTASFMDPDKALGRKFWDRVYSEAHAQFGTSDIPVDTFNKVWIMADKAKVFERDGAAFVVASHLKVMLESDYMAMSNSALPTGGHVASSVNVSPSGLPTSQPLDVKATEAADLSKSLIRQIILPAIEEEINQGKNFAPLRQMFYSMILATWYKKALKDALLNEVYTDQGKTGGVAAQDPNAKEKIFEQYLAAYRTGAVNLIREDIDPQTGEATARKYFSGGVAGEIRIDLAEENDPETKEGLKPVGKDVQLSTRLDFTEVPMTWMYVKKFAELEKAGKIAQGARIHIYMTLDKARQYRIRDGIISNATFHSIGTDGRIFFYPENSMPEANPNSLLASAISQIAVQGDFAEGTVTPKGVLPRVNPTTTENWMKLKSFADPKRFNLRQLFERDPRRVDALSIALNPEFEVDFSKNLIDGDVREALVGLAREVGLPDAIEQMFRGEKINETENRAVLHTALRNVTRDAEGRMVAANGAVFVDGEDVMPKVIAVLEQVETFTREVHSGEWRGTSGKKIRNIINVGIGGSDLGPKMAVEALKPYKAGDLEAYFLSNVDGTAAAELMKKLDPEETLVIVVSKTFGTQETMQNAQTMRQWVLNAYKGDPEVIKDHFVAVSTAKDLVTSFGIDEKNMFEFWDWVGGRYSVWSAVGLSLATYIGFDNFFQFLEGGREADEQFRTQPLENNISALKGLMDVWNIDFLGAKTLAVLPYDQYLGLYPAFTQQFYMESNGKSVDRNGEFVNYSTQPVIFGAAGTDGQHSFYEQLHQGTDLIPADFIGVINSHNDIPGHHEKFFSNFVAQTEALAFGATTEEVKAILSADPKYAGKDLDWNAMHQTFVGNKPTTSILIDKITPRTLGNLVAVYENEIFTAGIIWNIFSFDQWGVQLGKKVATDKVLPFLDGTRPFEDLSVAGLSSSATRIIGKFVQARQAWEPLDTDEYGNGPMDQAENFVAGAEVKQLRPTAETRAVKFGTSGDRGKLGKDFDALHVARLAQGTADYFKKASPGKMMLIGYDPREGNMAFARMTADIMAANGIDVKLVASAPTPTPVLAYLAANDEAVGGVINFTASHNPFTDDGFKFSPAHGGAAPAAVTDAIQAASNAVMEYGTVDHEKAVLRGAIEELDPQQVKLAYVYNYIVPTLKEIGALDDIAALLAKEADFHMIVDAMQGTAGDYLKELYYAIGGYAKRADFYTVINDRPDAKFANVNGEPRPDSAKSRTGLIDAVKALGGKGFGASVDGDADRFGNIDPDGSFIPANDMIALMAWFLKKEIGLEGAMGKTVATSNFTNAIADALNAPLDEEAVGFKYFVNNAVNKDRKYLVAGEESAHVMVGPFAETWDDGLVVGLMGLWMRARTGKSLTEYKEDIFKALDKRFLIETMNTKEIAGIKTVIDGKISKVADELKEGKPLAEISIVQEVAAEGYKVVDLITKDGLKMVLDNGNWLLVRPSGTQNLVKVYVEVVGQYASTVKDLQDEFKRMTAVGEKLIGNSVDKPSWWDNTDKAENNLDADDEEQLALEKTRQQMARAKPEILEIKRLSRAELLQQVLDMGPEDEFEAVKTGSTMWLDGAGLWSVKLTEDGVLRFNQGASETLVFSAKIDPAVYAKEQSAWNVWKDIEEALMEAFRAAPDKAEELEILEIKGLSRPELVKLLIELGDSYNVVATKAGRKIWLFGIDQRRGLMNIEFERDGILKFNRGDSHDMVFSAKVPDDYYDEEELGWTIWNDVRVALLEVLGHTNDKAEKPEILEINGLSRTELFRKIEDFGPDEDFIVRKTGSILNIGKGSDFWKVDLTEDGLLKFYYDDTDTLVFTARMDPGVYAGLNRGWDAWDAVRGALMEAFGDTPDRASLNDIQGGIDLNGNAMGMDIEKSGKGVTMTFDPAMADRFRKGDFTGLTPVIIQIIPIASPAALLGMETGEPALAKT